MLGVNTELMQGKTPARAVEQYIDLWGWLGLPCYAFLRLTLKWSTGTRGKQHEEQTQTAAADAPPSLPLRSTRRTLAPHSRAPSTPEPLFCFSPTWTHTHEHGQTSGDAGRAPGLYMKRWNCTPAVAAPRQLLCGL